MDEGLVLLLVGAVLAASVLVALGSARTGVPVLVAFLALGMLLGSDGPGGIEFDDAELARDVGIVGLVLILFEGGLQTSWRRLRSVVVPAALLSTVGVVVTMLLTGVAAQALFDLTWLEAFLLGAVVASTDAAAVFATLRFTQIRRRLARTLEAESGGNDPMAIALTLGLIAWIESPDTYGFGDLVLLVVRQLGLGLVIGVVLARGGDVDLRAAAPLGRPVRPRGLPGGGRNLLRRRRRRGRKRLSLGLPRRPRDREHAVALPSPARRVPRGPRVPRAGRDVHRPRPARLPQPADRRRRLGARARTAPRLSRSADRGLGLDRIQRLQRPREGSCSAGRACAAPFPSSSPRSCSRRRSTPRTPSSTRSSSSSSSPRSSRARRSSASPRGSGCCRLRRHGSRPRSRSASRARSTCSTSSSLPTTRSQAPRCAKSVSRGSAIIAVVVRGDDSIPPRGSTIIEPGDRLFVLAPHAMRPAIEDVFSRWRRRV